MEPLSYGYGLPPDFSTHGAGIDQLIHIIHIFMLVLFVGWGIFLLFCLIRFRRRPGHASSYQSNTSKLPKFAEITVVLFEVFLLVGLSFPIWSRYKRDFPKPEDSLMVRVVAQQFVWNIHYPGEDGKFGRVDSKLMSDSNPLGIDAKDAASADDFFTVNQFHFPMGKPVIANISSKDVIHSFGVPVMRLKQDATPGLVVPIHFQSKQVGAFEIVCSQLCGVGHSLMKGSMFSDKPEDFDKWMKEQARPFKPAPAANAEPHSPAQKG